MLSRRVVTMVGAGLAVLAGPVLGFVTAQAQPVAAPQSSPAPAVDAPPGPAGAGASAPGKGTAGPATPATPADDASAPVQEPTPEGSRPADQLETVDAEDVRQLVGDHRLSATDGLILERLEERGRLLLLFPERIGSGDDPVPRSA